jgi:hypothetical protein
VELLSDAAKSYSTHDLLDKLQQLLDFLNIPGPVLEYLPAKDNITLRHMGVLDLHVEAAAQHAVDLMLGSSSFSSSGSTGSSGVAFFTVRLKEEVSSHYDLMVFALSGGNFSKWSKGSRSDFRAGLPAQALQLLDGTSSTSGSSDGASSVESVRARDMVKAPALYGKGVASKEHSSLFKRITKVLGSALEQVPIDGRTGVMQVSTFKAFFANVDDASESLSSYVWAVWW